MAQSCCERIIDDTFCAQSPDDETECSCKCSKIHSVGPGGVYTNFVRHVQSYHSDEYQKYHLELGDGKIPSESQASSTTTFFSKKESSNFFV